MGRCPNGRSSSAVATSETLEMTAGRKPANKIIIADYYYSWKRKLSGGEA